MSSDLNEMARRVIDANQYMTLVTRDRCGNPRVSPVYYAADRYASFYWVSPPQAHHSRNLDECPEVEIVIFDSTARIGEGRAVYLTATARVIYDDELEDIYPKTFGNSSGGRGITPAELRGAGPLRLWLASVTRCEVHVPGSYPVHGRGVDTRQAADPTSS